MKLIFLLISIVQCKQIIRNANIPSCKNCIYFNPSYITNDFTSSFTQCTKFGNKNILTDVITYNFADSCRNDETKCGKEGKYFEEEKNINLKILKYKIISNIPLLSIICFLLNFIRLLIQLKQ
jgi:hypothetical protein